MLDEARAIGTRKGPTCSVAILLETRPDIASELREALAARDIPSSAIAAALKRRGIEFNQESLQRHRRGACRC